MKKFVVPFIAALAFASSAVAGTSLTPRQAAALLHSGGPASTSVVCRATSNVHVFSCDVHLVKSFQGHHCLEALFLIPDRNVHDVAYSQASLRFCDRANSAAHPPLGE